MAITTLTIDEMYLEIANLARDEGVSSRESWNEVVDEVVEGHLDLSELDKDQDTEGMKEVLGAKWLTFKEEQAEEEAAAQEDKYEADTTTSLEEEKDKTDKVEGDDEDKEEVKLDEEEEY